MQLSIRRDRKDDRTAFAKRPQVTPSDSDEDSRSDPGSRCDQVIPVVIDIYSTQLPRTAVSAPSIGFTEVRARARLSRPSEVREAFKKSFTSGGDRESDAADPKGIAVICRPFPKHIGA